MGDRLAQIEQSLDMIDRLPQTHLLRRSRLYESKAWGKTDQADFLNMVAEIRTGLRPQLLLRHVKSIETKLGRQKGERWGPRPIDIDILLYGNERLDTITLTVPHPRMWERRFVLRPLADLLPDLAGPDNLPIKKILQLREITAQDVREYKTERDLVNEAK